MNILHSDGKHFKLWLWNLDSVLKIKKKNLLSTEMDFGEELQEHPRY